MSDFEFAKIPGVTMTEFHYGGVSVQLDPQWAASWYKADLEERLKRAREGGDKWGWFWIDQRSGKTFQFVLSDAIPYAFTVIDHSYLTAPEQIIDGRIHN